MKTSFRTVFNDILRERAKILRPIFFPKADGSPVKLVPEETYIQIRLSRMFLKNRREFLRTKYPVVHALIQYSGWEGRVESNFVVQPQLVGEKSEHQLNEVVTLNQTILGPILYRGGDMGLVIGLYAAPAVDWAQRFISLAEGISKLTLNAAVTAAIATASVIKKSMENALLRNGLELKLGLDAELQEDSWLQPGSLVMIAAPENSFDSTALRVEDDELRNEDNSIYGDHDYLVLAIESSPQRSDWQSLGYGTAWQKMLRAAAEADDIQLVKNSYQHFSSIIMTSSDLSWRDRSEIVGLAQEKIKQIRDVRNAEDFLDGAKSMDSWMGIEQIIREIPELGIRDEKYSLEEALQTHWLK